MIRQNLTQSRKNRPPSFSTLGRNSVHWSFSKARRFRNKTMNECPELLELPSTLDKRSTSFGYGRRWQPTNPCGKDAPSPDKYNIPSCFDNDKRGPVILGNQREFSLQPRSNTPGPGTYDVASTLCKNAPKFTFRPKIVDKVRCCSPPPGAYNPRYRLQDKGNYSEITFGVGSRSKDNRARPSTPGPGTYEVPSSFCKSCTTTAVKFYSSVKNKVLKR